MDSLFEELIAINSGSALKFFADNSQGDGGGGEILKDDETLYVASVLAHYSQTSRADTISIPSMANLSEVFDSFILHTSLLSDAEILEIGGSQILLFAGFFRDQMSRRHNVRWYDQVGQSGCTAKRASIRRDSEEAGELFDRMAESFPAWTIICRDLSRQCRDKPAIAADQLVRLISPDIPDTRRQPHFWSTGNVAAAACPSKRRSEQSSGRSSRLTEPGRHLRLCRTGSLPVAGETAGSIQSRNAVHRELRTCLQK